MYDKLPISKDEFTKLIAEKAGFTILDTKDFVNAMIEVFFDAVDDEREIKIENLGRLRYKERTMKPSKLIAEITGSDEPIVYKTVYFQLSPSITSIIKNRNKIKS